MTQVNIKDTIWYEYNNKFERYLKHMERKNLGYLLVFDNEELIMVRNIRFIEDRLGGYKVPIDYFDLGLDMKLTFQFGRAEKIYIK